MQSMKLKVQVVNVFVNLVDFRSLLSIQKPLGVDWPNERQRGRRVSLTAADGARRDKEGGVLDTYRIISEGSRSSGLQGAPAVPTQQQETAPIEA